MISPGKSPFPPRISSYFQSHLAVDHHSHSMRISQNLCAETQVYSFVRFAFTAMESKTNATKCPRRRSNGEDIRKSSCAINSEEVNSRKERKRASDRAAQREHRKRQRQYVEELESQLEMVKQGSHSQSVATLMAENEKLKTEVRGGSMHNWALN